MKRLLVGVCCTASLVASGSDTHAADPAVVGSDEVPMAAVVDTGIAGVVMPPEAIAIGEPTASTAAYDLPGWQFEDATKWIGDRLPPKQIEELQLRTAQAQPNSSFEWCWQSPDRPFEVLLVSVFPSDPVNVVVADTDDNPAGC